MEDILIKPVLSPFGCAQGKLRRMGWHLGLGDNLSIFLGVLK